MVGAAGEADDNIHSSLPTYLPTRMKDAQGIEREERHRKRQGLIDVEGIQSCKNQKGILGSQS